MGRVGGLADPAVVIGDGGDAHLTTRRDQDEPLGTVAYDATAWRGFERVDDEQLARLQAARAAAREHAWATGAGPDLRHGDDDLVRSDLV